MIEKSTRHSKIIGNFGEQFMANWLSRSGFEVVLVDHTGIDIIAFNNELTSTLQEYLEEIGDLLIENWDSLSRIG